MQGFTRQQLGSYRLHQLIGQGSFGHVYLGEHIYLRNRVAIKVVWEQVDPQCVEAFLKEAQTIAALKHPHILQVLDFGIEGAIPFLVMEYAPNGTLRQKYPHGTKIPFPTVLSHAKQIALALQYAHDNNIVHRDVKPGNMLVDSGEKIVLCDFGLAVPVRQSQSVSTQVAAGTVHYMAPEQIRGKACPASDQYALGVTVYEWLSGVYPFNGLSFIEIAIQHILDAPPPLRENVPNITAEVEQVILRALAKEPKQRFPTIQEFVTALEQAYQPADPAQSVVPPKPSIQPVKITRPEEVLFTYQAHSKEVSAIDWSPDGTCIVSGGRDEIVQAWHVPMREPRLTYHGHSSTDGHPSTIGVSAVAWSPDGSRIASAGNDETAQVWNETVQIWEASTGERILRCHGYFGSVHVVTWSPDGRYIASLGGWDSVVQIWDASTGRSILIYQGHTSFVHEVAWSPDGAYLASGGDDNIVQVWDAHTGALLKTYAGHSKSVTTVTWSPDGAYIGSGSSNGQIHVWEISTGNQIWRYDTDPKQVWPCLRWSPDGTRIASWGRGESTVQIWEASAGKLIHAYHGHSCSVGAIAWSPDGSSIASGDYRGVVHVWKPIRSGPIS